MAWQGSRHSEGGLRKLGVRGRQGGWGSVVFPLVASLCLCGHAVPVFSSWCCCILLAPKILISCSFSSNLSDDYTPAPLWTSLHLSKIQRVSFFQRPFLFLFYSLFDGFSQHLMVMILTFISIVDLFPEFQVQMSNIYCTLPRCFPDTLNWKYPNSTESFLSPNWSSSWIL